jgi:hypothetical protein
MTASEQILKSHLEARADVKKRCIDAFMLEGHPRRSANEIVKHMSYIQQCEKIGQRHGHLYEVY